MMSAHGLVRLRNAVSMAVASMTPLVRSLGIVGEALDHGKDS